MFLKNKHVIASMIITPILALISYFAVDYYVSEVPQKAQEGQLYKMLVKPNCRWQSGYCDVVNGDVEINITTANKKYGRNILLLNSKKSLTSVKFAVVKNKGADSLPDFMSVIDANNKKWQSISLDIARSDYMQFVIALDEVVFYVEVPAIFIYQEDVY